MTKDDADNSNIDIDFMTACDVDGGEEEKESENAWLSAKGTSQHANYKMSCKKFKLCFR